MNLAPKVGFSKGRGHAGKPLNNGNIEPSHVKNKKKIAITPDISDRHMAEERKAIGGEQPTALEPPEEKGNCHKRRRL